VWAELKRRTSALQEMGSTQSLGCEFANSAQRTRQAFSSLPAVLAFS
jgi:hypothetical protein